jgi:hypothetical protein
MSSGEELYLLLVICTFALFAVSLAFQAWQWSRMDTSRRGVESKSQPAPQAERRLAA